MSTVVTKKNILKNDAARSSGTFTVGLLLIHLIVMCLLIPEVFSAVVAEVMDLWREVQWWRFRYWLQLHVKKSPPPQRYLSMLCFSKFPMMLLLQSTEAVVSVSIRQLSSGLQIQVVKGFLPWSQHHVYFGPKPLPELILQYQYKELHFFLGKSGNTEFIICSVYSMSAKECNRGLGDVCAVVWWAAQDVHSKSTESSRLTHTDEDAFHLNLQKHVHS